MISDRRFGLTLKNNISLWLQLLLAKAWLFSSDKVAVAEGVAYAWWEKKTIFVKDLDSKFQLFSQQPST